MRKISTSAEIAMKERIVIFKRCYVRDLNLHSCWHDSFDKYFSEYCGHMERFGFVTN